MESPVPGLMRSLAALDGILRKAETYCVQEGLDPRVMLEARLAATMKPMTHQIRLACNAATELVARLAMDETASIEGAYATFADLHSSVERARAFIGSVPESAFAMADERVIPVVFDEEEVDCSAHRYLTEYAIPNFYFAMTTTYAILRNRGVPVNKKDFLGVGVA
ncbi:DUF1993 domain-containing protein [Paradevosia shaoguanensis]|uniref:DUF1993 domain-containing protein n=1 Tax=Paradevosia shaoguanensis TaxID=1335043 RepID=UPI001932D594|nr:DUF1993 domain-containing protein [Paradevosia shaoguanensis]